MKSKEEQFRHTNRHHEIPHSRGGANSGINIKRIDAGFHSAFHHVFQNQIPSEQVRTLLTVNWEVLTEDFTRMIMEIIESDPQWIYNADAFRSVEKWKKATLTKWMK